MNVEEVRKERQQLFDDIVDNKTPHHVPSFAHVGFESAIIYGGYDLLKTQWGDDPEPYYQSFKKIVENLHADNVQFTGSRPVRGEIAMGSKTYVMSNGGYIQHPEVISMYVEDYDALIADPYKFIVTTAIPRVYTNCDIAKDGYKAVAAWMKGDAEFKANAAKVGNALGRINREYPQIGYFNGMQAAPFDYLADGLRSFSEINKDIRRVPQKVLDACEALTVMLTMRYPTNPQKYRFTDYPLHMAPFMRTKDVEKFWWPSFEKLVTYGNNIGQSNSFFCEADFTRFKDMLTDLPGRIMMRFERGDMQAIMDSVGTKHIVTGFYPSMMFATNTKQECLDKAKEILDVCAPGGNYEFFLDKAIYRWDDEIMDKASAVFDFVREYSVY